MSDTLSGLAVEQTAKAERIARTLCGGQPPAGADVKVLYEHLQARLERIANSLRAVVTETTPVKARWDHYKECSSELRHLEWTSVVALERFTATDAALHTVVLRICRETGAAPAVLTVSWSNGYYHLDDEGVLYIPRGELGSILGWPDIYHELSHRTIDGRADLFHEPIVKCIRDYFGDRLMEMISSGNNDATLAKKLDNLRWRWSGPPASRELSGWYVEFVADMLAAFHCGSAYADSLVRLNWNLNKYPFEYSESHPADAARFEAVIRVLDSLGIDAVAAKDRWNEFIDLTGSKEPPDYQLAHPPQLIDAVRDIVLEGCKQAGLVGYRDSKPGDVSQSLNEAWQRFRADAASFPDWGERLYLKLIGLPPGS